MNKPESPSSNDRNKLIHGLRRLQELVNEENRNQAWKSRWALRIGLVFILLISAAMLTLLLRV
jgi:hypothetical protein